MATSSKNTSSNLIDEEQGSETNALVSALTGVASGLIKVLGVISLGGINWSWFWYRQQRK